MWRRRLIVPLIAAYVFVILMLWLFPNSASASVILASWYGHEMDGSPTASGEIYNSRAMTAAHPDLPFGTKLTVCKDRCAVVQINDRCSCSLDLSEGTAERIGLKEEGSGPVEVSEGVGGDSGGSPSLPSTGGPGG